MAQNFARSRFESRMFSEGIFVNFGLVFDVTYELWGKNGRKVYNGLRNIQNVTHSLLVCG